MRIHDYHTERLRRDPEYALAVAQEAAAQTLADRIVDARVALGWSQQELAGRSGTSQPVISKLECGVGNPTLELITRIRAALSRGQAERYAGVTPVYAFTVSAPAHRVTAVPNAFILGVIDLTQDSGGLTIFSQVVPSEEQRGSVDAKQLAA